MSEPYEAIIFGRRQKVLGWTDAGHLQLASGRLELEFVDEKPVGKIHRIASYREKQLHTSIDGQFYCPQDLPGLRYTERMLVSAAMAGICSYPPIVRNEIIAVIWSSDANGRTGVCFLTRCDEIKPAAQRSNVSAVGTTHANTPEFFTSRAQAAAYLGVSERTIRNWIRDGWLKGVEKKGRKIRIARVELDKCRNRQ